MPICHVTILHRLLTAYIYHYVLSILQPPTDANLSQFGGQHTEGVTGNESYLSESTQVWFGISLSPLVLFASPYQMD